MALFTMKFPELAHLPVDKRREIVTRCLADPAFGPLRGRFARLGKVFPAVAGIATYGITSFVPTRHWVITLALIALGIVLTVALITIIRLWCEARLLRQLVRDASRDGGENPSGTGRL